MKRALLCDKKKAKEIKHRKRAAQLKKLLEEAKPHVLVATDGSSFGNPGPSGAGFYFDPSGMPELGLSVHCRSTSLGHGTNNHAELRALDEALGHALSLPPPKKVWYIFLGNPVRQVTRPRGLDINLTDGPPLTASGGLDHKHADTDGLRSLSLPDNSCLDQVTGSGSGEALQNRPPG